MMAIVFFVLGLFVSCMGSHYYGPYYDNINPNSATFKADLGQLLSDHKSLSYKEIWGEFSVLDTHKQLEPGCTGPDNTTVGDVYSAKCWLPKEKCGNYKREGDCFNREHVWPKSWFGGFSSGQGAQTDLFELYPADGYVNSRRGNYPLGTVDNPTYTSTSDAKLGPCTTPGFSDTCFEVADIWKGDFARSYFYLSVTYAGKWKCCDVAGVNKAEIKPWLEDILRQWHKNDPPSEHERIVNDLVEKIQGNRSPFVDHPEWVDLIKDF